MIWKSMSSDGCEGGNVQRWEMSKKCNYSVSSCCQHCVWWSRSRGFQRGVNQISSQLSEMWQKKMCICVRFHPLLLCEHLERSYWDTRQVQRLFFQSVVALPLQQNRPRWGEGARVWWRMVLSKAWFLLPVPPSDAVGCARSPILTLKKCDCSIVGTRSLCGTDVPSAQQQKHQQQWLLICVSQHPELLDEPKTLPSSTVFCSVFSGEASNCPPSS